VYDFVQTDIRREEGNAEKWDSSSGLIHTSESETKIEVPESNTCIGGLNRYGEGGGSAAVFAFTEGVANDDGSPE
jgi:hypothetical protein